MVTRRLLKDYKSVRKIGIGRSDRVLLRHVSGINNLSDKGFSAEVHDEGILPAYRRNYYGGGVSISSANGASLTRLALNLWQLKRRRINRTYSET